MRVLGIVGLAFGVLSFLFWIVNWFVWTFLNGTASFLVGWPTISQFVVFVASLFEYLAILCICIGLIVGQKSSRKSKVGPQSPFDQ